jgi:predicted RNA-binding Zn-ribbon protein involved in translation (DUF1610 family)
VDRRGRDLPVRLRKGTHGPLAWIQRSLADMWRIAAAIGQKKNLPLGGAFAAGALLGIIGVIIVLCQRPNLPPAPPGMRAVKCPRCNTIQNVPEDQRVYECWQCKASNELCAAPTPSAPAPALKSAVQSTKVRCHACQGVQTVPVDQASFVCEQCGHKLRRKRPTSRPLS